MKQENDKHIKFQNIQIKREDSVQKHAKNKFGSAKTKEGRNAKPK